MGAVIIPSGGADILGTANTWTGTNQFSNIGIGAATGLNNALLITQTLTGAAAEQGIRIAVTGDSSGTTSLMGVNIVPTGLNGAASTTVTNVNGFAVGANAFVVGGSGAFTNYAGLAIGAQNAVATTNAIGVSVGAITSTGTNNIGIDIAAPSGGATLNLGLRNAGTSSLVGAVGQGFAGAPTGNGINIGAASTNNSISAATQGAGTTALLIGNATITVVSDKRIKDNIEPYSGDGMALIRSLDVVEFDYKEPNRPFGGYAGRSVGFIAQDLNKVAPWAVHTQGGAECDACLDGEPCDEHPIWMARYEFLIGPIVKALQDVDTRLAKVGA